MKKSKRRSENTLRQMKINNFPKSLGHNNNSHKREFCSNAGIPQETKKIWNNITYHLKELAKETGLPWWLSDKESSCNAGDTGSTPGSGRSPGEGYGNLLQHSCLGKKKKNRASWAISNPERWCYESAALNMPANLENSAVATGLEKVSFHSNPKERQCQRMLKLPHSWTHLTR